jgi:hypothetical protein
MLEGMLFDIKGGTRPLSKIYPAPLALSALEIYIPELVLN